MGDVFSNSLVGVNCAIALALIRKCTFHFHSHLTTTARYSVRVLCALVFAFISSVSFSQFTEVASELGIVLPQSTGTATGISCYDFNKDGWDDLTIATNGDGVKTYLNNQGVFEEISLFDNIDGMFKSVSWIDFDNDGDADFFANRYVSFAVFYRNDGDLNFTDITSSIAYPIYDQRCYSFSWADYDNDRFLDLYMCNYYQLGDIVNWLFHNNGDGTFTEVGTQLGVDNGVATTYQASWFDYDLDHDVDLFVTNDRFFGNKTYGNNGDGTFTDISESTGTGAIMEAMGIGWSDFDRDGDFDYYLPNTEPGSILFQNNDGYFVDVADEHDVACYGTVSWGAQWLDCDNDLYDDLYVANNSLYENDQNYFFIHQEDGSFAFDSLGCFENDDIQSYAAGEMDFDHNGFPDLMVSNVWPNSVSIWQNNGAGGNWLKLGLTGTLSNLDAIGTTAKLYVNDFVLMEQWQCGESFMTQNSQYELFGCGNAMLADSLIILWPSGWIDKFYNLPTNEFYSFVEGETFADVAEINHVILCNDSGILLNPGQYDSYLWSDNSTEENLFVSNQGNYTVIVPDEYGFDHSIHFNVELFNEIPVAVNLISPSCFDATDGLISLDISSENISSIVWENGDTGLQRDNVGAGEYFYEIFYLNTCSQNGSLEVSAPENMAVQWSVNDICFGETTAVDFLITGGTGEYNIDLQGENPNMLHAGNFPYVITDENACAVAGEIVVTEFPEIILSVDVAPLCFGEVTSVEFSATGGSGNFSYDFDENDPDELVAGNYVLQATDEHVCSAFIEFEVVENSEIFADVEITNAENGSNGNIELEVYGGTQPYAYLWSDNSQSSTLENIPQGNYACQITDALGCTSFVQASVIDVAVKERSDVFTCYPNPFNNSLHLNFNETQSIQIWDVVGQVVYSANKNMSVYTIDTSSWPPGLYFVRGLSQPIKLVKE